MEKSSHGPVYITGHKSGEKAAHILTLELEDSRTAQLPKALVDIRPDIERGGGVDTGNGEFLRRRVEQP